MKWETREVQVAEAVLLLLWPFSQPSAPEKVLSFDFISDKVSLEGWEMALWVKALDAKSENLRSSPT